MNPDMPISNSMPTPLPPKGRFGDSDLNNTPLSNKNNSSPSGLSIANEQIVNKLAAMPTKALASMYMQANIDVWKQAATLLAKRSNAQAQYIDQLNNLLTSISGLQGPIIGNANSYVNANSVIIGMEHLGLHPTYMQQPSGNMNSSVLSQNSTTINNAVSIANNKANQLTTMLSSANKYFNDFIQFYSEALKGNSQVLQGISSNI